ncbi:hypothetical protein MIND_00547100 [Mycena indigotica]|uniref:Uncharacterized protein n=1 Tax=Mycena indigotica TaxID=2126181 RepID=A0A8H6T123_9AGAR|nr:uncharacterized protein MIND_00547100 [Mycena indigotica]KAF7307525.1 hypothetical protein MIND_00547100 [Mycena indigotica]
MTTVQAFDPPALDNSSLVSIEFCDRCRWLHRASWVQTELRLTFPPPAIEAITLIPRNSEETAGRFRVWVTENGNAPRLVWDRKTEGGFPELKVLVSIINSSLQYFNLLRSQKQRIRDILQPGKSLGHSDKPT